MEKEKIKDYLLNDTNKKIEFYSDYAFTFSNNDYSFLDSEPITMSDTDALEFAKQELNKMKILPINYTTEIYKVEEQQMGDDGSFGSQAL